MSNIINITESIVLSGSFNPDGYEMHIDKSISNQAKKQLWNQPSWITTPKSLACIAGGGATGTLTGAVVSIFTGKHARDAAIGAIIGISIGTTTAAVIHYRDLKKEINIEFASTLPKIKDHMVQIAEAINILAQQNVEEEEEASGIASLQCPINGELMVFPVNTNCQQNTPHIFEMKSIIEHIKKYGREATCPSCRTSIDITQLTPALFVGNAVRNVCQRVLTSLEPIAQRAFPNNQVPPNFRDIIEISTRVRNAASIFTNTEDLRTKIGNPDQLSPDEAYAISYYVTQVIRPMVDVIDTVAQEIENIFETLRDKGKISGEEYSDNIEQVRGWATTRKAEIIPDNCINIKRLMD